MTESLCGVSSSFLSLPFFSVVFSVFLSDQQTKKGWPFRCNNCSKIDKHEEHEREVDAHFFQDESSLKQQQQQQQQKRSETRTENSSQEKKKKKQSIIDENVRNLAAMFTQHQLVMSRTSSKVPNILRLHDEPI